MSMREIVAADIRNVERWQRINEQESRRLIDALISDEVEKDRLLGMLGQLSHIESQIRSRLLAKA